MDNDITTDNNEFSLGADLDSIDDDIRKELVKDESAGKSEEEKVCGMTNSSIPRCYDIRDINGVNYDTPI